MEGYHSGNWVWCSGWQPWGPDPYTWSVQKSITYTITDIGRKEYVETCTLHTYTAFGPNVTYIVLKHTRDDNIGLKRMCVCKSVN